MLYLIQQQELQGFPLLMVTDYHHGGYNLDDNEIGMVIICSGIVPLIWQVRR